MAESTIVKSKRDGTILIEDGTGTPLTYTVAFEAGDFSLTIAGRSVNLFLDRGVIAATPAIRYGEDQPMTFTFTAQLRDVSDATDVTLAAILMDSGIVNTAWISTLGSTAEVKTFKFTLTIEGTDHGDSADHTIVLDHCYLTGSVSEGDPSTVSISGTCYAVYPTLT